MAPILELPSLVLGSIQLLPEHVITLYRRFRRVNSILSAMNKENRNISQTFNIFSCNDISSFVVHQVSLFGHFNQLVKIPNGNSANKPIEIFVCGLIQIRMSPQSVLE